jgi:cbb3-type cytochrome c oxidase subunit III
VKDLLVEVEGGEGRRLFTSYCLLCHGPTGKGDGPLAKTQNLMPADLTVTVPSRSDIVLRKIISGERRETITGREHHSIISDTMPSWSGLFTSEQMDALIEYLRLLSTSKYDPTGNPESGIVLYQQYCQSCHGVDGSGDGIMTRLVSMEPMDHTDPVAMNRLSNDDLLDSILNGAGEYMPAWRGILSESEVEALISHIRLLAQ